MELLPEEANEDIRLIAANYRLALIKKADIYENLALLERSADEAKSQAILIMYAQGEIDGKTAPLRVHQENVFLLLDADYQTKLSAVFEAEIKLNTAEVEVKYQASLISLTKAALYSLSFSALGKE